MRKLLLLTVVFMLIPVSSSAASSIQNMIDVPAPIRSDGSQYSIDAVRTAIITGCQTDGWTAEIIGERAIRAKLNIKNKHYAVVEIPYSESTYSIIYKSSTNLDYNEKRQTIHRNYNKWVLQLSTAVNREFLTPSSVPVENDQGNDRTTAEKEDIFDELMKLDELRDRGILTDEEFEVEKRELLEQD